MPALRFSRKCREFPGCIAETYTRSRGGRGGEKSACRKAHGGVGSGVGGGRWEVKRLSGREGAAPENLKCCVKRLGVLRRASANRKEVNPGGENDRSAF